ncbi:hypothetical protein LB452_01630 [Psychroflexus sp. CAK8W]|uniref:Uncharacterized protein n=1 Tax=Psychroflexus longus TaxID=2873596 RepID=A0ABS7XF70_9FLAO|nr:hypothetical protein [Psychroflexus longus]MBZ9777611.1 hypothetical protein [Psychroflexus longus]
MNKIILLVFVFISSYNYAQGGINGWDENYRLTDAESVIKAEMDYARKVEKDTAEAQYYVSMQRFRFVVKYTGNEREIEDKVLNSMRNVFKMKMGSTEVLNDLVSREFEFDIGKSKVWMPVQNQLINHFENELEPGQDVLLYCLLINEHKFKGSTINTFLVSEFLSEWE